VIIFDTDDLSWKNDCEKSFILHIVDAKG
jgi:hypothetical protein